MQVPKKSSIVISSYSNTKNTSTVSVQEFLLGGGIYVFLFFRYIHQSDFWKSLIGRRRPRRRAAGGIRAGVGHGNLGMVAEI